MNICTIDSIRQSLIDAFKSETILPLLGSGFSMHNETESEGIVPSGGEYKQFFNGHDTISDSALQKLLEEKNVIVLFDIGSITREQFKKLILNFSKINKNRNNVVIILSKVLD